MPDQTVGIIGLGLIGGSLARDLAATGAQVVAWDRDAVTLAAAHAAGVVRPGSPTSFAELAQCDVVVLALPVPVIASVLRELRPHLRADALVTDVASTKGTVARAATELGLDAQFVGAHPLAGDHRSGWAASRVALFRDATVYLCPGERCPGAMVQRAERFWGGVGADTQLITPEAHDLLLAHTSHLPQTLAFLLAGTMARAGVPRSALGPGGRDTLRLAASPVPLWSGITCDNAPALLTALQQLRSALGGLEEALRARDEPAIRACFEQGRSWFADDSGGGAHPLLQGGAPYIHS